MIQVSSNNRRLLICSFLVLNASTVIRIPLIMHHIPKITTKSAAINSQISGNSKRIIQKIIWKIENNISAFLQEYIVVVRSTIIQIIQAIMISMLAIMIIVFNDNSGFKQRNRPNRI